MPIVKRIQNVYINIMQFLLLNIAEKLDIISLGKFLNELFKAYANGKGSNYRSDEYAAGP